MGKKMSKRALLSEARRLNAIDLTNDREVRKGCERGCLTEFAHSEGVVGCNGRIYTNPQGKFFFATTRRDVLYIARFL